MPPSLTVPSLLFSPPPFVPPSLVYYHTFCLDLLVLCSLPYTLAFLNATASSFPSSANDISSIQSPGSPLYPHSVWGKAVLYSLEIVTKEVGGVGKQGSSSSRRLRLF